VIIILFFFPIIVISGFMFSYLITALTDPAPVTDASASPRWLHRHGRHRIWLRNIQPYVFCDEYRERNQRRSRRDFELFFEFDDGEFFLEFFLPRPVPSPPGPADGLSKGEGEKKLKKRVADASHL
jgi:hypothetical protein